MPILALGVSYRRAGVELLERLSFVADDLPKAYRALVDEAEINEAVILSTCNRVEVYAGVGSYHAGFLALKRVLTESREVAPEEVPLAPQDPADVALAGGHLQTDREVRRGQGRLQDEEPEDVPLRTVQEDRGPLEGDHPPEGLGDGMKERIAREVRDDGVGDLEQRAVARRRPYGRFGPRGSVH